MLSLPRWRFLLATAGSLVVGCSSVAPAEESKPEPESLSEAPAVAEAAKQQFVERGVAAFTVPSSLAGATTWTVYLGAGISVVATDDAHTFKAALLFATATDTISGVACAKIENAPDCASIVDAVARDLGGDAPATQLQPSGLRPLSPPTANPRTECETKLSDTAAKIREQIAGRSKEVMGDYSTRRNYDNLYQPFEKPHTVYCAPSDEDPKRLEQPASGPWFMVDPGDCVTFYGENLSPIFSAQTKGIGSACCSAVEPSEGEGNLQVDGKSRLVVCSTTLLK